MAWFDTRLNLWGDKLEPAFVDALLGVSAEFSWKKGQEQNRRDGGGPSYQKTGYWCISTQQRVTGDDPEAHLLYLVSLIEGGLQAEELRDMIDKIALDINVQSEGANEITGSWEGHLGPALLNRMAGNEIGLRLTFLFNNPLI